MELNQCINYLLTTSQHRVFQEVSKRLEPFDVTPVQYGVLYCLWKGDKTNLKIQQFQVFSIVWRRRIC